jgi:hypothetical protein
LAWLEGERDVLQVTPRRVTDPSPTGLHGVFAVRSPARPNPIGLTLARVAAIDARMIQFDLLDFVDGTPVVDLKPYFVSRDIVFGARNVQIGRPPDRKALRESLMLQAQNFHGEICPDLELAVDIVVRFRAEVLDLNDPPDWSVAAPGTRLHLIDALMGMTRATFGRGSLRFGTEDAVVFNHLGRQFRYDLGSF